jgi:hypothetical protein
MYGDWDLEWDRDTTTRKRYGVHSVEGYTRKCIGLLVMRYPYRIDI